MNDDAILFTLSLALTVVISVLVAGVDHTLRENVIEKSFEMCETNNGLSRITIDAYNNPTAYCRNGAEFSIYSEGEK